MIKGHVCIDLHNHKSGFTERIEKDNLVTNAVQGVINAVFGTGGTATDIMPLYSKTLGGVMLFDGLLTESVSNVAFPQEAHLVGYGSQDSNVSDLLHGSYNATESHRNPDGFTSVWDFGTSQANGTIRSLGRTMSVGSGGLMSKVYSKNLNTLSYHYPILFDEPNKELYVSAQIDSKMTIRRYRKPLDAFAVYDSSNETLLLDSNYATVELPPEGGFVTYAYSFFRNAYDGYAYLTYTKANNSGDGVLKYRRIKLSDKSFALEDEVSITCENCLFMGGTSSYGSADFAHSIISKGYAFVVNYARTGIYIIDLANTTDIKFVEFPAGKIFYDMCTLNSGVVVVKYNQGGYSYIYNDGHIVNESLYFGSTKTILSNGYIDIDSSTNSLLTIGGGYLGTICNLTSDVVKTPSHSMKITYTLTNV